MVKGFTNFLMVVQTILTKENIKHTFTAENVGLCSAINIITKKASKSYLIYTHDDMYFCPNWEQPLVKEINKQKKWIRVIVSHYSHRLKPGRPAAKLLGGFGFRVQR